MNKNLLKKNKLNICEICKREFKPKSNSDKYCGILCLNASIKEGEQEDAIKSFINEPEVCPICRRHKRFLVHKRMDGNWYLYQEYHYDYNKKSTYSCYYCNLWEMNYRRRTGKHLTPEEHRLLLLKLREDKNE